MLAITGAAAALLIALRSLTRRQNVGQVNSVKVIVLAVAGAGPGVRRG